MATAARPRPEIAETVVGSGRLSGIWNRLTRDYCLCPDPRCLRQSEKCPRGCSACDAMSDNEEGWRRMGEKTDQAKGRVKEAAGVLVGDKDLESEGQADRRAGEAKEKLEHAKDKIEEVIDDAKEKAEEVIDKVKDAARQK